MFNRFKTILLLGLTALGLVTPTLASASPLSAWYGRFLWEENVGRIGGPAPADGVTAFITYTLILGPGAGDTGCLLHGEGYQTDVTLKCTATPELGAVIIKFYTFDPRPTRYYPGQPLFTMRRGENGIVTRLQGLAPSSRLTPLSGILFRRID